MPPIILLPPRFLLAKKSGGHVPLVPSPMYIIRLHTVHRIQWDQIEYSHTSASKCSPRWILQRSNINMHEEESYQCSHTKWSHDHFMIISISVATLSGVKISVATWIGVRTTTKSDSHWACSYVQSSLMLPRCYTDKNDPDSTSCGYTARNDFIIFFTSSYQSSCLDIILLLL